jgi:hypothetical protein
MKHRIGNWYQVYSLNDEPEECYLLADKGGGRVLLVNLVTGVRWNDAVRVESSLDLTEEEWISVRNHSDFEFKLLREGASFEQR